MNDLGPHQSTLDRPAILRALGALSDELGRQGVKGELCLFGGTVMVLAFTARLATKDVDALFQPTPLIRELARRIGEDQQLPTDWLNDGVKGFLSARHETTAGNLPQFQNLSLTMPVPEYLLAMKCMAARLGGTTGEASDVSDIDFLIRRLKLPSAAAVLDIVGLYYPANRIPVKNPVSRRRPLRGGPVVRPKTLAEVARLTAQGDSFDHCLANFLDQFYAAPQASALHDAPPLLAPHMGELGHVEDAYLAATAEELARHHGLPLPAWTDDESRKLHRPWFASPLAALRAVLLLESPPAFRARNLFVSENALSRA